MAATKEEANRIVSATSSSSLSTRLGRCPLLVAFELSFRGDVSEMVLVVVVVVVEPGVR